MVLAALAEYGVHEIAGPAHNPRILEYGKIAGFDWYKDDETSWCGIFMAFCAKQAGLTPPKDAATARNWLNFGTSTTTPAPGDIVVYWRESLTSWKGHVGMFIRKDGNTIYTLGGNQNNQVCIAGMYESQVLGYRTANLPVKLG